MARLTDAEITNIILAKGFKPVDISGYQNKQSKLTCQCSKGHLFTAALQHIEKDTFRCPKCEGARYEALSYNGEVPEKRGYRIIGFDQSSNIIGVSIYDSGKLVYYDWYKLTGDIDTRLSKWFTLLNDTVIPEWKPDFITFEDTQYQEKAGIVTFRTLSEVLGVGIAAATLNNIEHTTVLSKVWKSEFQISGNNRVAEKRHSVEKVKELFGISVSDDIADSILIGLWSCHKLYKNWAISEVF